MAFSYSGTFSITGAPTITLTSPNSGTFYVGDSVNITWTTTGSVGNVKIELYNTANSLVGTITSSTSNDGSYSWTIAGSMIAQYETEYQLKIFQVSGSSPSDYSGNLSIYPYQNKTADDKISISQDVDIDESIWLLARTVEDTISIAQSANDAIDISTDTWKHVRTTTETLSIAQSAQGAISVAVDTWKHVFDFTGGDKEKIDISQSVNVDRVGYKEFADTISISQGAVGAIVVAVDTWRHSFASAETLSIDQTGAVIVSTDTWKHYKSATDRISIDQTNAVIVATDKWKHYLSATDKISLDQTDAVIIATDKWKHILDFTGDNIDLLSIAQDVTIQATAHYEEEASETLSIDQTNAVIVATDKWKHILSATDTLSLDQTDAVIVGVDKWIHLLTSSETLSIDQTDAVEIDVIDWIHVHEFTGTDADKLSIAQEVGVQATHHYEFEITGLSAEKISILQAPSVDKRTWKFPHTQLETLSIDQTDAVGVATRDWKHIQDITGANKEYLDLGDVVTIHELYTWKYNLSSVDAIGITQDFASYVNFWRFTKTTTDDVGLSDAPFFYVTRETGVMYFIYQNTVINLGNANRVPVTKPIFPKQLTKLSGDGKAKVTDYSSAVEFVDVKVRVDQATRTILYSFFRDNVSWTKNIFTFKDGEGSDYDVRLWDADGFNLPILKGGHVDVGVRLRKELYN